MKKFFIAFIVFVTLAGCSSNKMRLEDRSELSLRISEEVIVLDDMFYSDMQSSVRGGIGSLLGDIVANGMEDKEEQFSKTMIDNNVDIQGIVLRAALGELDKAKIKVKEDAELEMKFTVRLYGFGQKHGLSKKLHPIMVLETKITDEDEEVLFKDVENITTFSRGTASYSVDEYIEDSSKIEEGLEGVAAIAVSKTIEKIR
ncbi:hypothetical protein PM10SUCC1_03880 [Propionigenium maris DSM 9537]|uniref:Lipoprotein n=1 Tax=Propionigenium maris DSM 9537 TaxID=1123000 RepID=A0A9W6LLY7_9FUSO|nr:hypothetical protein [Propionigenium maris]GLI54873.1 hypothetical protein PM10SUCC1_03880 [Propionigenium maris DSM 9537]